LGTAGNTQEYADPNPDKTKIPKGHSIGSPCLIMFSTQGNEYQDKTGEYDKEGPPIHDELGK
jgi:hypothetical protein